MYSGFPSLFQIVFIFRNENTAYSAMKGFIAKSRLFRIFFFIVRFLLSLIRILITHKSLPILIAKEYRSYDDLQVDSVEYIQQHDYNPARNRQVEALRDMGDKFLVPAYFLKEIYPHL